MISSGYFRVREVTISYPFLPVPNSRCSDSVAWIFQTAASKCAPLVHMHPSFCSIVVTKRCATVVYLSACHHQWNTDCWVWVPSYFMYSEMPAGTNAVSTIRDSYSHLGPPIARSDRRPRHKNREQRETRHPLEATLIDSSPSIECQALSTVGTLNP